MTVRRVAEKYTGRMQSGAVGLAPRPATVDPNDEIAAAP
jgi:hypothetical protein